MVATLRNAEAFGKYPPESFNYVVLYDCELGQVGLAIGIRGEQTDPDSVRSDVINSPVHERVIGGGAVFRCGRKIDAGSCRLRDDVAIERHVLAILTRHCARDVLIKAHVRVTLSGYSEVVVLEC